MRRATITFVFLAGLGLMVLLLLARVGPWPRLWPLTLLDTFALQAFLPFVAVGLAAFILRSSALALLSLTALLFFVQQFSRPILSTIIPSASPPTTAWVADGRVRVLTFNVHAPNVDPGPLLALVQDARPDLIVLQEVTTNYAEAMDSAISGEYPFSIMAGLETEHEGAASWSRLPLVEQESFQLSELGNVLHRARVSTGTGEVWLYNVHLSNPIDLDEDGSRLAALRRFDDSRRDRELRSLVNQTSGLTVPFILAGDLNISAGSHAYREFPPEWRDDFSDVGRGFGHTFPSPADDQESDDWFVIPFPLLRIDYIVTSPHVQVQSAWTQELRGSDHYAVIADLQLPPTR